MKGTNQRINLKNIYTIKLLTLNRKYMDLEKQVVNLELSKKFKELGFKQDSCFEWIWNDGGQKYRLRPERKGFDLIDGVQNDCYSAYTVAELGEILPSSYKCDEDTYYLTIEKKLDWWKYGYEFGVVTKTVMFEIKDLSEANARAKMLIYLKENKII